MRPPASAACAAAIALAGAGAAGWPTSMCTTWPPPASMRAAAAITSITMKGGTLLRPEGSISRFARSNIVRNLFTAAPLPPHLCEPCPHAPIATRRDRDCVDPTGARLYLAQALVGHSLFL